MNQPATCASWLLPMLSALGACHQRQPPLAGTSAAESTAGHPTAFGPRILSVDAAQRTVTFSLEWPAQVILVSVTPGQFAVPVGALTSDTTRAQPGLHTIKFVGDLSVAGTPNPAMGAENQGGYDRCVRTGTQRLPTQPVVRRDSAGKTTSEPRYEPQPHAETQLEQSCRESNRRQVTASPQHAWRYLVLMATNTPMTLADAIKRFEGMRDIPNDLRASIQAVATALYADRNGTWSAHYVPW